MAVVPESFLIFKEELQKEKLAKEKLTREYEDEIGKLNQELLYLKEQIEAQKEMIKTTINYAERLELDLGKFDEKIKSNNKNGSYH